MSSSAGFVKAVQPHRKLRRKLRFKLRRKLPLNLVQIVPFILQVFAAVGLTGYFSLQNGQRVVNQVSNQLRQEKSSSLKWQVLAYFERPYLVGNTIASAARENQFKDTPVILSSANNNHHLIQKFSLKLGYDAFLPKPIDLEKLLHMLRRTLQLEWVYRETA
jgi:CheY-like chemotaxis protein